MDLILIRRNDDGETTKGDLFVNGAFFCFTLEDTFRHDKVAGKTRIPAGRYKLTLDNDCGNAMRYQSRFGARHSAGMITLERVPDFTFIQIHIGNTEDDTAGCILVGAEARQQVTATGSKQTVLHSTDAYLELYSQVATHILGGDVYITIIDN